MKKCLLLATALLLVATQAMAVTSIRNTKHDLSSSSTATNNSTNYDEICVFCHTPHKAVDQANAPLWNRSGTGDIAIALYYNSATLDTESHEAAVSAKVLASDAKLCLSCHDGASLTNDLANPLNSVAAQPLGLAEVTGAFNLDDGHAGAGVDLHDDHPIGMVYNTIYDNTTAEFKNATATTMNFYDGGVMWCSSCHDVHDNTFAPFLAADNTKSALCLSCHIK